MLAGDANDAFTAQIAGFMASLERVDADVDAIKQPATRC
jgi:hypothetical protein